MSKSFTKGVEKLVNPIDVGSLHFIQSFNKYLPKPIQKKLVTSSSKKIPYMGFVVEPYATFLCYEIKNIEKAKELLPNGYELIKTKVFEDDEPKYICIFGCFTAHTSAFWGSRIEFYVIAKDLNTGLLSWLIIDYDSNTISYDKKDGLRSPNAQGVVTTSCDGRIIIDFRKYDGSREVTLDAVLNNGIKKRLDQKLWLEGNLSIGYGRNYDQNTADIFSLKFDPCEVGDAIDISFDSVEDITNTWFKDIIMDKPYKVLTFPYAQHFISDSPGASSKIKNREELVKSISNIDFNKIEVFSTKSFKTMFLLGSVFSFIITTILLILLIIK